MSAAHSIETEAAARGHDVKTVDVLDHTGKGFRGWYRGGYEVLVRKKPKVWGHLYKSSDRKRFNYRFQTALDSIFVRKMRDFVTSEKPDWIICTHSLPQPALERWRRRSTFRVAIVVTDLYPQLMWLRGNPDWFFVPGEWSKEILAKRYPRSVGRTTVTGIPVSSHFATAQSKGEARCEAGLDPATPVVLVTSGGIGGGPIGAVVDSLSETEGRFHAVIVCGRSEQAYARAMERAKVSRNRERFTVLGHVTSEKMAELMHAADIIVAKPGGITTFEALAVGLPFVVFDPFLIPGQEERNAEFLVETGIGIRVKDASTLGQAVSGLLSDETKLSAMSAQALKHAQPHAAALIVDQMEAL